MQSHPGSTASPDLCPFPFNRLQHPLLNQHLGVKEHPIKSSLLNNINRSPLPTINHLIATSTLTQPQSTMRQLIPAEPFQNSARICFYRHSARASSERSSWVSTTNGAKRLL